MNDMNTNLGERLEELGYFVSYGNDGIIAMFSDIAIIASHTGFSNDFFAASIDAADVYKVGNAHRNQRLFQAPIGAVAYDAVMGRKSITVKHRGLLCNHDHSESEILSAAKKMAENEEYRS